MAVWRKKFSFGLFKPLLSPKITIHSTNYVRHTADNQMRAGATIDDDRWWRREEREVLEGRI
jgi:hypothetical protein